MKNKKWIKLTALAVLAVVSAMLLASCQPGATHVDEPGDESKVTVIEKDELVEIPYTGEPIKNIIYTD